MSSGGRSLAPVRGDGARRAAVARRRRRRARGGRTASGAGTSPAGRRQAGRSSTGPARSTGSAVAGRAMWARRTDAPCLSTVVAAVLLGCWFEPLSVSGSWEPDAGPAGGSGRPGASRDPAPLLGAFDRDRRRRGRAGRDVRRDHVWLDVVPGRGVVGADPGRRDGAVDTVRGECVPDERRGLPRGHCSHRRLDRGVDGGVDALERSLGRRHGSPYDVADPVLHLGLHVLHLARNRPGDLVLGALHLVLHRSRQAGRETGDGVPGVVGAGRRGRDEECGHGTAEDRQDPEDQPSQGSAEGRRGLRARAVAEVPREGHVSCVPGSEP